MIKIPLNNAPDIYAIIDNDDFKKISIYDWKYVYPKSPTGGDGGYAMISKRSKDNNLSPNLAMHRLVTNCPKEMLVHHINFNKLDNRKSNLLICTRKENSEFSYQRKKTLKKIPPVHYNTCIALTMEERKLLSKYLDEIRMQKEQENVIMSYEQNGKFYIKNSSDRLETTELLDPSFVMYVKGKGYLYKGEPVINFSNEYVCTKAAKDLIEKRLKN